MRLESDGGITMGKGNIVELDVYSFLRELDHDNWFLYSDSKVLGSSPDYDWIKRKISEAIKSAKSTSLETYYFVERDGALTCIDSYGEEKCLHLHEQDYFLKMDDWLILVCIGKDEANNITIFHINVFKRAN